MADENNRPVPPSPVPEEGERAADPVTAAVMVAIQTSRRDLHAALIEARRYVDMVADEYAHEPEHREALARVDAALSVPCPRPAPAEEDEGGVAAWLRENLTITEAEPGVWADEDGAPVCDGSAIDALLHVASIWKENGGPEPVEVEEPTADAATLRAALSEAREVFRSIMDGPTADPATICRHAFDIASNVLDRPVPAPVEGGEAQEGNPFTWTSHELAVKHDKWVTADDLRSAVRAVGCELVPARPAPVEKTTGERQRFRCNICGALHNERYGPWRNPARPHRGDHFDPIPTPAQSSGDGLAKLRAWAVEAEETGSEGDWTYVPAKDLNGKPGLFTMLDQLAEEKREGERVEAEAPSFVGKPLWGSDESPCCDGGTVADCKARGEIRACTQWHGKDAPIIGAKRVAAALAYTASAGLPDAERTAPPEARAPAESESEGR